MSVSNSFRDFVLDQLGTAASDLRAKSMFGGVGVYSGTHFFALIDDDTLYLKGDEITRPSYEANGMKPFQPYGEGGEIMHYYAVSEGVLEDPAELAPWVEHALGAARRKKGRKKTGGRKKL